MKVVANMEVSLKFPVGKKFVAVTFHLREGDDLTQIIQNFIANEKIPCYLEPSILSSLSLLVRDRTIALPTQDYRVIAAETVANSCNVWTQKLTRFSVKWLDQSTSKHWAASNLSECSDLEFQRLEPSVKFISVYHTIMNGPSKFVIEQIQRREIKDAKAVGEMIQIRDQEIKMLREKQSEEMIVCLQESTPVEAFVSKHLLQMEQTENYWKEQIKQLKHHQKEFYHSFLTELFIKNKEILLDKEDASGRGEGEEGGGGGGGGEESKGSMYFFWQNNQKEGAKRVVGPGMRKKEGNNKVVPTKDDTLLISLGTQHRYLYNIRLTAASPVDFLSLERPSSSSSSSSSSSGSSSNSSSNVNSSSGGLTSSSSLLSSFSSSSSLSSSAPSPSPSPSPSVSWRPPLLRTCRMLYSHCLSALVNVLGDLEFRTPEQEVIYRTCDRSTDYHFSSLPEQIDYLVEEMGDLCDTPTSNNNNEMKDLKSNDSLFYERDGERKEGGEKQEKKDGGKDVRVGDFVITRHSNLYKVHLLFHLLTTNRIATEEEAKDEKFRGGVEVDLLQGLENVLCVAAESGVGTLIIPLFLLSSPSPSSALEQSHIIRATTILKTVRAFLTNKKENCDLRTIQFLVPPSPEVFIHYRNLISNVFQNCAVIK